MQLDEPLNRISIFDLDGTLSIKDTYRYYLLGFLTRSPRRWFKSILLPFAALLYFIRIKDNQWLKTFYLTTVLGGEESNSINSWNKIFLDRLFKDGLRSDIIETLKEKKLSGETIVLATASLDIYVSEFAQRLNIDHVICTNAEWQNSRLTGNILGNNCYGHEKLQRVKKYLSEKCISGEIHIYSDHSSDWPLLDYADFAYAVYPTPKLRKLALHKNIPIIE